MSSTNYMYTFTAKSAPQTWRICDLSVFQEALQFV